MIRLSLSLSFPDALVAKENLTQADLLRIGADLREISPTGASYQFEVRKHPENAVSLREALRTAEATLERIAPGGSRATQGTRDVITAALGTLD